MRSLLLHLAKEGLFQLQSGDEILDALLGNQELSIIANAQL
jgi:hypothetical protein